MEQQFEVVDRDYSENFEGVTSHDRGIVEKIKLTEQSRNNMDSKYQNVIGQKSVEAPVNEVVSEKVEDTNDNVVLTNVEQNEYEVSRVIPTSKKAIKFAEYMVDNTDAKYAGYNVEVPEVKVEDVDTKEIKEAVDNSFDFYNINQEPEAVVENDAVDTYEPSENYAEQVGEETALDNLVNSQEIEETQEEPYYAYEEEISPIEESKEQAMENAETDVEVQEEPEINENIVPEIENYFSTHDIYDIDDIDGSIEDKNTEQEDKVDLYDEVSNSIEDENITIEDLDRLREALQSERDRKARLTQELEEQQMAAAAAEREEQEAVKEKEAKIIEFNDELNALRNENESLEKQTEIIAEKTQETNSNVVNIRDYVSALDRIMNEASYSGGENEMSAVRGKVA